MVFALKASGSDRELLLARLLRAAVVIQLQLADVEQGVKASMKPASRRSGTRHQHPGFLAFAASIRTEMPCSKQSANTAISSPAHPLQREGDSVTSIFCHSF